MPPACKFFLSVIKVQVLDFSLFAISFLIFNYDLGYKYTKVVNHNCARHISGKAHIKKCLLFSGIFYKNRWTKFINKNRTKVPKKINSQWIQKRFWFTKRYLIFITRNKKIRFYDSLSFGFNCKQILKSDLNSQFEITTL